MDATSEVKPSLYTRVIVRSTWTMRLLDIDNCSWPKRIFMLLDAEALSSPWASFHP